MDINELQYTKTQDGETTFLETNKRLLKFKDWFKDAVEASNEWREEAKEDYEFYNGKQWKKEDRKTLEDHKRPALTVNRIKPLLNVLSGYQRLNRYDIDFKPRTNDDMKQAQLRKGITKYILDESNYNYEESNTFFDGAVCGLGWFEVGYKFDWENMDGNAFVRSQSPLSMYVDPESRDRYFRDAKFIIRARWLDKEELITQYPEKKEDIEAQSAYYLTEEAWDRDDNRLWWHKDNKKIRIAECWYKKAVRKKIMVLKTTGEIIDTVTDEMLELNLVNIQEYSTNEVRVLVFFDNVVLEDIPSPYEHGELPFVAFPCYYQGEDDVPAGIVRDLKDPQREINKRRSQELHILNTAANGAYLYEEGAMSREQEQEFKRKATEAGAMIKVGVGTLTGGKIQPFTTGGVNGSITNATMEAEQEMITVSGINEALMGTDIQAGASGRAIELKQKQAITHIALLFDNLRFAKERVVKLLWGSHGKAGIIPQYYTEEKTFRIVGEDGKDQFVTANQTVQQQDPETMQVIKITLNDLSVGDYDIVIADTPSTATQRTAQFWSLVDACGQLGIGGTDVLPILLDLSDIAQKEELKQMLQKKQEEAAQQQQQAMQMEQQKFQAQMELEREKKLSKSIAYRDLQLPLQLELAAKAGIFPQEYADAFMQWSVQQYAQSMGIQAPQALPQQMPMQAPQVMPQGLPQQMPMEQPTPQTQARPLTQAAMNGLVEANKPVL